MRRPQRNRDGFHDRLKTVSRGYASLDYHLVGYRTSPMVKLDVLCGEPVDALSMIVHRDLPANAAGLISRLWKLIPRQQFEVALRRQSATRLLPGNDRSAQA
jgi:GTP-binding protein LepA